MRPNMTAVRIGLMLAMVFAASMSVTVPTVHAIELFLAGDNIDAVTTRVPGNDLVFSPPLARPGWPGTPPCWVERSGGGRASSDGE